MKNKATTYVLIAAAAGVWALIFYKIFTSGPPDVPISAPQAKQAANADDSTGSRLLLNYRDPFLEMRRPKPTPVAKKQLPVRPVPPIQEDRPNARYKGMVVRQNVVYALIDCGHSAEAFKKGDIISGDFAVRDITPDSVIVQKKGKRYVLRQ